MINMGMEQSQIIYFRDRKEGAGHKHQKNDTIIKNRIPQKMIRTNEAQDAEDLIPICLESHYTLILMLFS